MRKYLIKTERLGLRNWLPSDEVPFIEMCQDPEVMKHFPGVLTAEETRELMGRLKQHYEDFGYTYFAVDVLENQEFIGFAGVKNQTWESEFTPCVDIGWRLKRSAWGKGYATEAAQKCRDYAFESDFTSSLISLIIPSNIGSQKVAQKNGMKLDKTLDDYEGLKVNVFRIEKEDWLKS